MHATLGRPAPTVTNTASDVNSLALGLVPSLGVGCGDRVSALGLETPGLAVLGHLLVTNLGDAQKKKRQPSDHLIVKLWERKCRPFP